MKVLKFGGTSVGSAATIKQVKKIIQQQTSNVVVVVSALGGITDLILNAAKVAASGTEDFHPILNEIKKRHSNAIAELFNGAGPIIHIAEELLDELGQILTGITLVGELTPKTLDRIAGIGERISSHLVAQYIPGAIRKDASEFIQTDSNFGRAVVDFFVTNKSIKSEFDSFSGIAIVPGFIAKNAKGEFTTLGRGGSDYTAAILAAALEAESLEIWTDVNGFMTADPRVISKAYTIPELTYSEAMELSHFGAKVIYPPTILPVYKKGIPILVKNTFNPQSEGTLILKGAKTPKDKPIKGISSISGISLLTLQGIGMVGVTGISMRLFKALAGVNVNVILISQA